MSYRVNLTIATMLLLAGTFCLISTGASAAARPVVVELFTSEGCSDCPPADLLLTRLVNEQPVRGAHIIAIEEHISYWNNPKHWVDPFSSMQFTDRQYDYARKFNDDSPYTPEMVVNGSAHFVGSDENEAIDAIRSAETASIANVSLNILKTTGQTATIAISINNLPAEALNGKTAVLVAITEGGLISRVIGGENRGRTLPHSSVARTLSFVGYVSEADDNNLQTQVSLSPEWTGHTVKIVAFLQDTTTKKIYGADEKQL